MLEFHFVANTMIYYNNILLKTIYIILHSKQYETYDLGQNVYFNTFLITFMLDLRVLTMTF